MVGSGSDLLPLTRATVDSALAGDTKALRGLVLALRPVVQARVARTLLRRCFRGPDPRSMLEDFVQDTFVALLQDRGRLLRAWMPERGLSLESFVGLVAEQRVLATLRSRKKSPWTEELAMDDGDLDMRTADLPDPEATLLSREALRDLLDDVRARLTPMGHELFVALIVKEEPVSSVCARTSLSTAAVHAWSSRLRKMVNALARERLGETAEVAR